MTNRRQFVQKSSLLGMVFLLQKAKAPTQLEHNAYSFHSLLFLTKLTPNLLINLRFIIHNLYIKPLTL